MAIWPAWATFITESCQEIKVIFPFKWTGALRNKSFPIRKRPNACDSSQALPNQKLLPPNILSWPRVLRSAVRLEKCDGGTHAQHEGQAAQLLG